MKLLDYNKVLREFQYKPNFFFSAHKREDNWWLHIVMLVEDSRQPFRKWEVKPIPQDEEIYSSRYGYDRMPRPHGVGYSPSRELIEVLGNYPIPLFSVGDDEFFVKWLVYCIHKVEEHETDEWLRYKGELIKDPHKED